MKILFVCLLIIFSFNSNAQVVKFIKNPYQAKYRVYITKSPVKATQWIYRVKGPADIRKPGHWYIVTNPQLFSNAMSLYEVDKIKEADIVVYYVSTTDSAQIRK